MNIKLGKFSWEIVIELSLLEAGGNLFDAMNLAALGSLIKCKHNIVEVEKNEIFIFSENEKPRKNFPLNHVPYTFTFGVLKQSSDVGAEEFIFLDPSVF